MIASLDVLAGEFIHASFYLFAGHKPEVIILEEAVLTLGDIRLTTSINVLDQRVVELTLSSLSFDVGRQERATCALDSKLTCLPPVAFPVNLP